MMEHSARFALFALVLLQGIFVVSTKGGKCGRTPVDIVFVLDESGSIWGPHFEQQLQFIQDLIDGFDFEPNGTRVGVETFGTYVRTIIQLGEIMNAEQLKRHIAEIQQRRGSTGTHLALNKLREMFSGRHSRPGASRVAIVITDGESDDPHATAIEADKVHAEGITVLAIGVGESVTRAELSRIASDPDYVFTVDNYNELNSLLSILAIKACPVEQLETTTSTVTQTTKSWPEPLPATKTDEWIEVQSSTTSSPLATPKLFSFRPVQPTVNEGCKASVTFNVYIGLPDQLSALDTYLALQFIRDLTTILGQTPSYIRPILCPRVCPVASQPTESFLAALDGRIAETGTQHDLQLEYIRKKEEAEEELRQRNPVDYIYPPGYIEPRMVVAVLLLDNRLVNTERTMRQVSLANRDGIQVLTIGVGDYVDQNELRSLATTERDAIYVRSYCQLPTIREVVMQRICIRGLVQSAGKSVL